MKKLSLIKKHFSDSFYWIDKTNFVDLQKMAFSLGINWHTGDSDVVQFEDYGNKNLWFSPDGYFQSVPFWSPGAKYGKPSEFSEAMEDFSKLRSIK
jgi:hypothetical protein